MKIKFDISNKIIDIVKKLENKIQNKPTSTELIFDEEEDWNI